MAGSWEYLGLCCPLWSPVKRKITGEHAATQPGLLVGQLQDRAGQRRLAKQGAWTLPLALGPVKPEERQLLLK